MTHGEPGAAVPDLPATSVGAGAVAVLVDVTTGVVLAVDGAAPATGVALTAWAGARGMSDPTGRPLDDRAGPVARAARGEVVATDLVGAPASPVSPAAPGPRVRVTAVPLGSLPLVVQGPASLPASLPAATTALVSFVHLSAEAAAEAAAEPALEPAALDVWAHDLPGAPPGGATWHDVLALDDGAVGVVVGEVVGSANGTGTDDGAAVAEVRSVVRAHAGDAEPGAVLMRVDQLVAGARIRRSASAVLGRLSPLGAGAWEWAWACAGPLVPVLVRPASSGASPGAELVTGGAGPPLGATGGVRATAEVVVVPGDVLVLWTPGLVERGEHPPATGRALLERVCAQLAPADAAGVGEQLLEHLGGAPDRAAAVVVVRVPRTEDEVVPEPPGTPRRRRWQLPGDPSSIARARRHVATTCAAWGLAQAPEAGLVVSELVANAVLHGWGPVGLRVHHAARGLVVEVDDASPEGPRERSEPSPSAATGYGLQVVGRVAEWGWHRSGPGKTVWALLPGPPGPPGPPGHEGE